MDILLSLRESSFHMMIIPPNMSSAVIESEHQTLTHQQGAYVPSSWYQVGLAWRVCEFSRAYHTTY